MKKLIGVAFACGVMASVAVAQMESTTTTTTTTTGAGTIAEFTPGDHVIIRSETETEPMRYRLGEQVTYVTTTGEEIPAAQISVGTPVTVHYRTVGTDRVVERVVVDRTTTGAGASATETSTTTTTVE